MSTTTSDMDPRKASPEPYPETLVTQVQLYWGQGFLSPGGPEAVARILEGVNITGQEVLDLGCGIGGPSIELVNTFKAKRVVGIDVNQGNVNRAKQAVASASLDNYISFHLVQSGVLPLEDMSFDIVFSKDALVEVHDKEALFAEAFRVLRPGGWIVASDWLRADGPISASLQRWVDFTATGDSPHSFYLASLSETAESLKTFGFANIGVRNQNAWYREEARRELGRKTGEFWTQIVALSGEQEANESVQWHRAMIEVLDSGDFCPSNFRAQKPISSQVA
ncbi:MAG: class I SAM-dependent methyltransferase [Anaerolineales bacterium]